MFQNQTASCLALEATTLLGPERGIQRNILVFTLHVAPPVAAAVRSYKAGLRESPVPMPRLLLPEDLWGEAGVTCVGVDEFQTQSFKDIRLYQS